MQTNREKNVVVVMMKRSGTGGRKRLILEAIPFDKWIRAGDIAEKTGLRPQAVGIIIKRSLFPIYVERRQGVLSPKYVYEYKRRPVSVEPQRLRD